MVPGVFRLLTVSNKHVFPIRTIPQGSKAIIVYRAIPENIAFDKGKGVGKPVDGWDAFSCVVGSLLKEKFLLLCLACQISPKKGGCNMKKVVFISLMLLGVVLFGSAHADTYTIAGPTLNIDVYDWSSMGIQITALQSVTLTSFVFQNQGIAGTISLTNTAWTPLDTYSFAGGSTHTSQLVNVSWALTAGNTYNLVASDAGAGQNGLFAYFSGYPVTNPQIQVDQGIGIKGGQLYTSNAWWAGFNNITTTSAVPLPGAILLFGPGLVGLAAVRRRFKK
jgi:hypothetical protein